MDPQQQAFTGKFPQIPPDGVIGNIKLLANLLGYHSTITLQNVQYQCLTF